LLFFRLSARVSTVKEPSVKEVTVWQTPFMAMESPICRESITSSAAMVRDRAEGGDGISYLQRVDYLLCRYGKGPGGGCASDLGKNSHLLDDTGEHRILLRAGRKKALRSARLRRAVVFMKDSLFYAKLAPCTIFFHPDYTVGIGISPIQSHRGSRGLSPPVRNCLL
jgi:hypothetical protein